MAASAASFRQVNYEGGYEAVEPNRLDMRAPTPNLDEEGIMHEDAETGVLYETSDWAEGCQSHMQADGSYVFKAPRDRHSAAQVYGSGVAPEVPEEDYLNILTRYGKVVAWNFLRDEDGRPRGTFYAQMAYGDDMLNLFTLNGKRVGSRNLWLESSNREFDLDQISWDVIQ